MSLTTLWGIASRHIAAPVQISSTLLRLEDNDALPC
jgi:hypothetical protein